jgi:hypothetical protein
MIRDMTPEDKPGVLRLIRLFYQERLIFQGVHFAPEHAEEHFNLLISNPATVALCLIEEEEVVGIIAGVVSVMIFAKELALQEMVWYVEIAKRREGVKLLRAFEQRGKERGAQYVMMVGLVNDSVLEFYPRAGYVKSQEFFMKRLE